MGKIQKTNFYMNITTLEFFFFYIQDDNFNASKWFKKKTSQVDYRTQNNEKKKNIY